MVKGQRIPLEERLLHAWADGYKIPAIFGVFFDDYFSTLSEMSGRQYYKELYETCMSELNPPCGFCLVQEAVDNVAAATGDDRELYVRLLCRILAEPFADSTIWGEEGKDGTVHDNAGDPKGNQ